MRSVRNLTILGSTGSIGENTLDVVARHPDRFRVVALTANKGAQKCWSNVSGFSCEMRYCWTSPARNGYGPKFCERMSD